MKKLRNFVDGAMAILVILFSVGSIAYGTARVVADLKGDGRERVLVHEQLPLATEMVQFAEEHYPDLDPSDIVWDLRMVYDGDTLIACYWAVGAEFDPTPVGHLWVAEVDE